MKQKIIAQGAEAIIYLSKNKTSHPKSNHPDTRRSQSINKSTKFNEQSEEQFIIKNRIKKSYRIPELDNKIRTRRTRAETKIMQKISKIIPVPEILESNEKTKQICMEFIDGKKLSQHLDKFQLTNQKQILKQIGESVAKLHKENIIHGDLTTSNMIYVEKKISDASNIRLISSSSGRVGGGGRRISNLQAESKYFKIYFIDFGLAFQNAKHEDKAVDIHLLKQALEAKHFKHWETLYKEFTKGYKTKNKTEIMHKNKASRFDNSVIHRAGRVGMNGGASNLRAKTDAERVLNQLVKVEKRGRYRH